MASYAYERVSTKDQNLERQDTAIKKFRPEISEANIFRDKQTGKDFNRNHYNAMKIILEHVTKIDNNEIVEVIFEEMDRLGRNKEGIKKELMWFKEHGIVVRILEIPTTLCDISPENKWVMELVTQILIEVYASLAEQELEKRAKRQAEGIEEALKKGVKFGRPVIKVNDYEFKKIYEMWKAGTITAVEAQKRLGLKANTFYRRVKEYETKGGENNVNS